MCVYSVIALPMKIAGGSGGPVRVVALVPKSSSSKTARLRPQR
jgi:hypothetical protein